MLTSNDEQRMDALMPGELESPFMNEEIVWGAEMEGEAGLPEFETASPFRSAFEMEDLEEAGFAFDSPLTSSSTTPDLQLAVPPFPAAQRAVVGKLLTPAQSKAAARWNAQRHPSRSGVEPAQILKALEAYVDLAAVRQAINSYNAGHSGAPVPGGTQPVDAVFVEAVHQFQRKCFRDPKQHDGLAGPAVLDSLGFWPRKGMRSSARTNSWARGRARARVKKIEAALAVAPTSLVKDLAANDWWGAFVNPSFLGWGFSNPIHVYLARKLRVAERTLLTQPRFAGKTPVEMAALLSINERHAGGRTNPGSKSIHTFGLALDIQYTGNPHVGDYRDKPNGAKRFTEVMKRAAARISGFSLNVDRFPQYLHQLGSDATKTTAQLHDELARRDQDLRRYLALPEGSSDLAALRPGVFKGRVARDPRNGFLNLDKDLVIALRDSACLVWGAVDFGPNANGDIMHFDCRLDEVGRAVFCGSGGSFNEKHPCWRRPEAPCGETRKKARTKKTSSSGEIFDFEQAFSESYEQYEQFEPEDEDSPEELEQPVESEDYEDLLDETGEASELLFEGEAPPVLNLSKKSDPPGQTLYIKIHLGRYTQCMERTKDKARKCIRTKTFRTRPVTGIFIPQNYTPQPEIDLILYLHGWKTAVPGSDAGMDVYWDSGSHKVFGLREEINASGKNVILVAPTLGLWANPANLVSRGGLDKYLDKVLEALKTYGPYQGQSPVIGRLILAAHSGAGVTMRILALSKNQYAKKIKECWGLDSLYNAGDVKHWLAWASRDPQGTAYYSYYNKGLPRSNSLKLVNQAQNIFPVESVVKDHFKLVRHYLAERLRNSAFLNSTARTVPEMSEYGALMSYAPEASGMEGFFSGVSAGEWESPQAWTEPVTPFQRAFAESEFSGFELEELEEDEYSLEGEFEEEQEDFALDDEEEAFAELEGAIDESEDEEEFWDEEDFVDEAGELELDEDELADFELEDEEEADALDARSIAELESELDAELDDELEDELEEEALPLLFDGELPALEEEAAALSDADWEGELPTNPADGWVVPQALLRAGQNISVRYDDAPDWDENRKSEICTGNLSEGARALSAYLKANFTGIRTIGGYNCRRNSGSPHKVSIHGTGRALDIMIPTINGRANSAVGDPIAAWLITNAASIGVQYLIWNRVRWSGGRRRDKFARYTGPNPHIDHIHMELNEEAGRRRTPWFTGQPAPASDGAENLNLEKAARLNRQYGVKLGWQQRMAEITRLLGIAGSTQEPDFIRAVARWQARQGLGVDGILGPTSWTQMQAALSGGGGLSTILSGIAAGALSAVSPWPAAAHPTTEEVRLAQRILNAAEGENLKEDGDFGRLTRAALGRFRSKYGLGTGEGLDGRVRLALLQRALEETRQQSIFAQVGVMDAATREELIRYKMGKGLGSDPLLDAPARAALYEDLAVRTGATTGAAQPVGGSTSSPGAGLTPPSDPSAYRRFRLTTYHIVNQHDEPTGAVRVPIFNDQGQRIAEGSPAFFAKLSLEGSARLTDGRLINVTGKKVTVSPADYADVLAYHRQAYARRNQKRRAEGRAPVPTAYSGIIVENGRVVKALAFYEVPLSKQGIGYGVKRGIPFVPFRTLASDIGHVKYRLVEPKWKGKGGLVPPGTRVYIKEYDGLRLPDGTTHDGWFTANDTGGGIYGAHFDVFTGSETLRKQVKLPAFGQVWFPGIEQRIPPGYTYGLNP